MADPAAGDVPWDALAVGATRPAVLKLLNVPYWFVIPIIAIPLAITEATQNPFWLALVVPLTAYGRWLVARDHHRIRVLWSALHSGAMFADRNRLGGATVDPPSADDERRTFWKVTQAEQGCGDGVIYQRESVGV